MLQIRNPLANALGKIAGGKRLKKPLQFSHQLFSSVNCSREIYDFNIN